MIVELQDETEELDINITLSASPMQLFVKIVCPCCSAGTIIQKEYISEKVLCSKKSCRKVLTIQNFEDFVT